MSDLNDFLKVLSEGKKQKEKQLEESKKSLGDFLSVVAEAKAQDPKHQMMKEVKANIKSDIDNLFQSLSGVTPTAIDKAAEEKIDQLVEAVQFINDIEATYPEIVGDFVLTEDGKYVEPMMLNEVPEVKPAAEIHSKDIIDKYLRRNASFQQPEPDPVDPNIRAVQDKLKFLEQAIGRIAATGPGSGEVWFRWLDDVDRSTIDTPEADQEHVLRYNAATKQFFFGELTGDHREINSFTFDIDGPRIDHTPRMVYWNKDEDCLQVDQLDGTSCSVGLENYIQIRNASGSTLTHGSVVRFSGVYSNGDYVPEALPHIADGSIPPLYTIGVVTDNILPNTIGRATVLGKVRDVDTTGMSSSEVWNEGDILYVHPTLPGKLTKNKPTAPQIVVSVAAVLYKHATDGILLIRPTIFPRLYYGAFADKTNQTQTQINTPKAMTFNTTEIANGFSRGVDTSHIIASNSGLYNFKFSAQLVSTNSSAKEVWIWFRKNGVDIPDSTTRKTIVGNNVYDVAAWDITVSMLPNDYFQIMWAVSDTAVSVVAPAATAFAPAIPSVLLTVSEIAL